MKILKKLIYIFGSIIFIIDQLVKLLVINFISYDKVINIISNFFYLTHVKNTGGAWSIFSGNTLFLLIISLLCIIGIIFYVNKKDKFNKLEVIYFTLLFGGIIGNLFDRVIYSGVIDYIGMIFFGYYFPIFNIADICIVVGAILIIIDGLWGDKNDSRSK